MMNQIQLLQNFNILLRFTNSNLVHLQKLTLKRKKQAFWYKLIIVVISSSVTLILGLNIHRFGNAIALVLSSILTVLTTMDQFENVTTKHITLNKRLSEITKLNMELEFYLNENKEPTEEKFLEFKERYLLIIDKSVEETSLSSESIKEQIKQLSK